MKKIVLISIFIVIAMTLGACGDTGSSSDKDTGSDAAMAEAPAPTPEELNEVLKLYACNVLSTIRSNPDPALVPEVETDDNVALCDLNNDGLPELIQFNYGSSALGEGGIGEKWLDIYTPNEGKLHYCGYSFWNPSMPLNEQPSSGEFVYTKVSWGPPYALFIDSKGRTCIEASQGGATSGQYSMSAFEWTDKEDYSTGNMVMYVDESTQYDWLIDVSDDASPDIKFGNWNVENAELLGYEGRTRITLEEDTAKVVDSYEEELQGIKKVILYYGKENDPHYSDALLAEADENSMTYTEFLDYVTEQTGTSYEDLVELSFEEYMD